MLIYIIIAVLMFGFLIAVHELGHFLAAKALGVRVNEFAIGMGPALISRERGETLYSLRAFPIGGFCAMEGESEESDDQGSFHSKPGWKKFIILVAGALFNFVAGVLILLILVPHMNLALPVVTGYMDGAQDLEQTGLLVGDQIYRIDGHRIYFSSDASMYLERAGDTVELEVLRDGERVDLGKVSMPLRALTDESGNTVYKRGIYIGVYQEMTPANVLRSTLYQSINYLRTVWMGLGDLITGAVGLQDMSGPIGIVSMMGQAGQAGAQAAGFAGALLNILNFVAFIAINLAVMNLLPIPALDGGQILFLIVGGIYHLFTRRRIALKYLSYINMAGFFCLIALMVVVAVSDVFKQF